MFQVQIDKFKTTSIERQATNMKYCDNNLCAKLYLFYVLYPAKTNNAKYVI